MIGTMTAGTVALLAGGAAAKTAADIYGAKKAGDAAKQAGNQAAAANQAALDYQKEQDALDREDARRAELENQGRYTREQARAAAVYGDEAAAAARAEDAARRGEAFDQVAYAAQMQQMVYEAAEAENDQKSQECFAEYFEFVTLVRDLRNYPDLILRFRRSDLAEWTRLKIDRETLIEFVMGSVEALEEAVEAGTEIGQEIAFQIAEMADFYKVELSPKLSGTLKFYLDDSEEMEGGEEGGGSSIVLQ